MLKPFKVYPGTIRPDVGDPARGYKREELERAWKSYPSEGGIVSDTTLQMNKNSNLETFYPLQEDCVVTDTIAPNSKKNNDCNVVTDTIPPLKGDEDQEALGEREAIMEYEGGMTREEAKARAREDVRSQPKGDRK